MYASDYGYAAGNSCFTDTGIWVYQNECKEKDWLNFSQNHQWLMTPLSSSGYVAILFSTGTIDANNSGLSGICSMPLSVRPTFYLTSTTSITSGTGTMDDPYIIDN